MCYIERSLPVIELWAQKVVVVQPQASGKPTKNIFPLSQTSAYKDENLRPKTQYFKAKAYDTKGISNRLHDSLHEQR